MAIRKFGTGEVTETDTTYNTVQQQREALRQTEEAAPEVDEAGRAWERADEEPFQQFNQ